MAAGIINLQKASGGITKISGIDGTGVTELVVPESGELVNKDYADLKVALESFTGTNQNLAVSGYQKLPGGLIMQWGSVPVTATATPYTMPITFPNAGLIAVAGHLAAGAAGYAEATPGTSTITLRINIDGGGTVYWYSIGY